MNRKILISIIMAFVLIIAAVFLIDYLTKDIFGDDEGKVGVIVTIVPQEDMVRRIGGDLVKTTVMVPPGQSPHSYEPTPSQLIDVSQAEVYFKVGSGVEFELVHMDTIRDQNSKLEVIDLSQGIEVKAFSEHYSHEHEEDEHQEHEEENGTRHEDDEGTSDPHVWLSPVNFKTMVTNIYNGLVKVDPDHEKTYRENYDAFVEELDALHNDLKQILEPYKGRSFLTYHPAWGYFGDAYELKQLAIEEEGKQPGSAGVAAIIEQAKTENITVVFFSPQFDSSSAEVIAEEIGGRVVMSDPLAGDYELNLRKVAKEMVKGFNV